MLQKQEGQVQFIFASRADGSHSVSESPWLKKRRVYLDAQHASNQPQRLKIKKIKMLTSFRLANKTLLGHRMNVKLQRGRWCSPPATEALGELAWETLGPRKCLIEYVARRESRGVHHSRVCYVASFMQTDSCWKWIGGKQNHLFNFLSPSLTHTLTHKEELSPLFHSGCLRLYELSLWWPVLPEDSV